MKGLEEQAQRLLGPPEEPEKQRPPGKDERGAPDLFGGAGKRELPERSDAGGVEPPTFKGTGRREATPARSCRHGSIRWWRGRIHVGGVTLSVVASPSGISLPSGVTLDDDLYERVETYLTSMAARLNRQRRGGECHE